jgi:hypothetical protein
MKRALQHSKAINCRLFGFCGGGSHVAVQMMRAAGKSFENWNDAMQIESRDAETRRD